MRNYGSNGRINYRIDSLVYFSRIRESTAKSKLEKLIIGLIININRFMQLCLGVRNEITQDSALF